MDEDRQDPGELINTLNMKTPPAVAATIPFNKPLHNLNS
jgi:hypothetical protein